MRLQDTKRSSPSDPWAALDRIMKSDPEPVGPEWFTVEQFSARYELSRHAHRKLMDMLDSGVVERWKGLSRENRRITVKYRLKK